VNLFVDTMAYSAFVRGEEWAVRRIESAELAGLPIIVMGELHAGFEATAKKAKNEHKLIEFLNRPGVDVYYLDDETARVYGTFFQHLRRAGTPIPLNDIWIAALTHQHSRILLTRDKHFRHLPQIVTIGDLEVLEGFPHAGQ